MNRTALGTLLLVSLTVLTPGCNIIQGVLYLWGPRRIEKAQFKLTEKRLAVVIECKHARQDNPVFTRTLHEKIAAIINEKQHRTDVVSYAELLELRRASPEFGSWSIQRIGRALEADAVLYVVLDNLRLRESPDHPLISPAVTWRTMVISAHQPRPHHRLWPENEGGVGASYERQAHEAGSGQLVDTAAAKLASDTAHRVLIPFFDLDTEVSLPTEP